MCYKLPKAYPVSKFTHPPSLSEDPASIPLTQLTLDSKDPLMSWVSTSTLSLMTIYANACSLPQSAHNNCPIYYIIYNC